MTAHSPEAERAHTVLRQALTARVSSDASIEPVDHPMSRVRLSPAGAGTHRAGGRCLLEVADAAPVAVRERIRSRVQVVGHEVGTDPSAVGGDRPDLHLAVDSVVLVDGSRSVPLSLEEVLAAPPDPLASSEAGTLAHLATAHEDVLRALLQLVPHGDLLGMVSVLPLRLDRRGIDLRIEYLRGHRDRRLEFEPTVSSPADLTAAMTLLIARARVAASRPCARASSWPGSKAPRSPVEAILRAADAARRLCGP